MSHQYSGHEADFDEEYEEEAPRSRVWVSALTCIVLAATGSGAAFAYRGYGGDLVAFSAAPKPAAPSSQTAVAAISAQDALLKSVAEAQQRAAAIAQGNQQLLQAQAAEIKRLSDTVAQLATRVDAMGLRNAQAAVPPHEAKKPAAPKAVAHKPAAPAPMSLAPAPEEKK